jgi:hypothetical protein
MNQTKRWGYDAEAYGIGGRRVAPVALKFKVLDFDDSARRIRVSRMAISPGMWL